LLASRLQQIHSWRRVAWNKGMSYNSALTFNFNLDSQPRFCA
jgi:hypothetical protein